MYFQGETDNLFFFKKEKLGSKSVKQQNQFYSIIHVAR